MSNYVLITGGARGIGRATVLKFAKEGYGIITLCHRNNDMLISLSKEISSYNVPFIPYVFDISDYDKVINMYEDLQINNCLPDIIINNAAISYVGLLQDMTCDEWKRVLDTNLTGVFNICKAFIPHLIKKQTGRIINISSMWGNVGASCEVAYSASKGGINAFTKALSKELAPSNIPVNAIAFGMVDTDMNSFLNKEDKEAFIEEIPAGRMLTAKEAADIIFSVAGLNSYVTGQIISADGGYT